MTKTWIDPTIAGHLEEASRHTGVPVEILQSIAKRESGFDPDATARTSSAKGLFQFIDSTWSEAIKAHGGKYGIGAGTSPFDARANALMGAEFIKANAAHLKSRLGRDPQAGELYIAHFLGAGGAEKLMRASDASPEISADSLFPEQAAANRSVFYRKDGTPKTVSAVHADLIATVESTGEVITVGSSRPTLETLIVPAAPADPWSDEATLARAEERDRQWSIWEGVKAAAHQEFIGPWLFEGGTKHVDETFRLDAQRFGEDTKTLPEHYWEFLAGATSEENYRWRLDRALADVKAGELLAEMGWTGVALRVGAGMFDPVGLAIAAATGGFANVAYRGSRGMAFIRAGSLAAVSNVAVEAVNAANNPNIGIDDVIFAAGAGMALGGAVGVLARNPEIAFEAGEMARVGRRIGTPREAPVGDIPEFPDTPPKPPVPPKSPPDVPPSPPATTPPPKSPTEPYVVGAAEDKYVHVDGTDTPTWAGGWAKFVSGMKKGGTTKIVYEDDGFAIFEVYSRDNAYPYYMSVDRAKKKPARILSYADTSSPEGRALQRFLELDRKALSQNPNGPFQAAERLAFSQSVDANIRQAVEHWIKILGIKGRIFIGDYRDVQNMKGLHGPWRTIRGLQSRRAFGLQYTLVGQDAHLVTFRRGTKLSEVLETIAHEIGHAFENDVLKHAKRSLKAELGDAYRAFRANAKNADLRTFFEGYHSINMQRWFTRRYSGETLESPADTVLNRDGPTAFDDYWTSFPEWWANQVARWLTTSEVPRSAIDRFFSRIAAAWRKLVEAVKGKALPVDDVVKWLDEWSKKSAGKIGADDPLSASMGGLDYNLVPWEATADFGGKVHVDPIPTKSFLQDRILKTIDDDDAPKTAFASIRWGVVARLKKSRNPLARAFGAVLGEDSVGNADHSVNRFSATEDMERLYRGWMARYAQVRLAAFREWAKSQDLNWVQRQRRGWEFFRDAARYVRSYGTLEAAEAHPSVKRLGDEIIAIQRQILAYAKNPWLDEGWAGRAVAGFESVNENPRYLMRVFDNRRINEVSQARGSAFMERLVAKAIRGAQPHLDDGFIQRIARGYVRGIRRRAAGVEDRMSLFFSSGDTQGLKLALKEDIGLDDETIAELISRLPVRDTERSDTRALHRVFLDETVELDGVRFQDILVEDANLLFDVYTRHMAGAIALARVRIKNAAGEMVVDGITSDSEWTGHMRRIREGGADRGMSADDIDDDIKNLEFLHRHLRARPDPSQLTTAAEMARLVRKYNFIRLMNQVGFAQMSEAAAVVGQLGIKAAMRQMPAFRRIVDSDGRAILRDGLAQELEAIMGVGTDRLRGVHAHRWDEFTGRHDRQGIQRVEAVLDHGVQLVADASGFNAINMALQRWAAKVAAQHFANLAAHPTKANMRRMASLGLDEVMLQRILTEYRAKVTLEDGVLFKGKVRRMNLDDWDDFEARAAFEQALFRWGRRVIQENDIGDMHRWMSNPMAQLLLQFRNFPLVAWSKQFLHNVHMRDAETFTYFTSALVLGGASYVVQEKLRAIGRDDAEEYLARRLTPENIALAAFSKAGWSSIAPNLADTVAWFTVGEPLFDFRTTGNPSDIVTGNPTGDLIDSAADLGQAITKGLSGDAELSQKELRDAARAAPMQNFLPFAWIFNAMIADRPERPAR